MNKLLFSVEMQMVWLG